MNIDDLLWYALFASIQVPFMAMGYRVNWFVFALILVMATVHATLLMN